MFAVENKGVPGFAAPDVLKNYPAVDQTRISGETDSNDNLIPVGAGNEHVVYWYLTTEGRRGYVLKLPRIDDRNFKTWSTPQELYQTYSYLRTQFGDAIPETYFIGSINDADKGYCIIQREIPEGSHLTVDLLLNNANLLRQFTEIIETNSKMFHDTGRYLPLLGREGALAALRGKGLLTNLVVEGEGDTAQLHIVDFGLLAPDATAHMNHHPHHSHETLGELIAKFKKGENVAVTLLNEAVYFGEWVEDLTEAHIEALRDGASLLGNEIALEYYFLHRLRDRIQQETHKTDHN